jgi:hypothetical protein
VSLFCPKQQLKLPLLFLESDYVAVFVTDTKSAVNSLKPIPSTIYGNPASSDDKYKKGITAFEVEHAIKGLLSVRYLIKQCEQI